MKRVADIKKWERCEKMLWLSKRQPQPFTPYIVYHENIYALAKEKLLIEDWLEGQTNDQNNAFFDNEDNYYAFCKMRFTFQDFRIRIPIMIREKKGYHIYFVYPSCYPKEGEAQPIADQLWVLQQLHIKVVQVSLIHLNAQYVREENLDAHALLAISDTFFNDKNHLGQKVSTLLQRKKRDVSKLLDKIDETLQKEEIIKERTNICTRRNKCSYFDTCFTTPKKDTSILNLVSSSQKFSLLEAGVKDIKDLDIDQIEGTRHQFAQIMAAKTNTLFMDRSAVKQFFSQIEYPISYLDFEWETYAFPPYHGMKPFDVLTFQYSLHIENAYQDELIHKEYLGMRDCREGFIQHLIQDIPSTGSIMCFNVEGAEKLRLKQLAKQFPQYEEVLKSIWERMIDLAIPFSNGLIYDNRMEGMYSLKKLVAIFTDYNYANLDISHGMEAVSNYRMLDEISASEKKEVRRELLEYCAMDTYAMVLMYHWILNQL